MPPSFKTIPLVVLAALAGCNNDKREDGSGESAATVAADTESGTESETAAAESDSSTSTTFVPVKLDMASAPPSACDPFMQDCPEGEKCVPYVNDGSSAWNADKCVPVMGDGQAGDPCKSDGSEVGTDDCSATTLCWDVMTVEGEQTGVCTPFCGGTQDAPICDPGRTCMIVNKGVINMCVPVCDPLLQECGEGLGCYWMGTGFACVLASDELPLGEPCGYLNDCAPGNFCADASVLPACANSACCAAFCDLEAPMCEMMGTECSAFFEENQAPPGYENVGVCVLPG